MQRSINVYYLFYKQSRNNLKPFQGNRAFYDPKIVNIRFQSVFYP